VRASQVRLAYEHRRSTEPIAREHATDTGAFTEAKDGQIAAIGFTDASLSDADFNTGNRVNSVV
jgi:hypothetical protein